MKVQLEVRYSKPRPNSVHWTEAEPFFVNPRGLLVHRTKAATTYSYGGHSHVAVSFLCSAGTSSQGEFTSEPPPGKLLCERCERQAKKQGLPSADILAGRHVHVGNGRTKGGPPAPVKQTCCNEQDNNGDSSV